MAQGGAVQVYFGQNRDASVDLDAVAVMGEVAAFCRARQAWVQGSSPTSEIAVVLSKESAYRGKPSPFGRSQAEVREALRTLVEAGWTVDVVGEHSLRADLLRHRVVVAPERAGPGPELAALLAQRAAQGGSVVVAESSSAFEAARASVGGTASTAAVVILPPVAEPAAATVEAKALFAGSLLRAVEGLVPTPSLRLSGAPEGALELVTTRKGDESMIHLINTTGPHATELIMDRIEPVGPVAVEWRRTKQPREVTLQPGARRVEWTYAAGVLRVTVPRVEVHEIVVVRE
jgi:hypothetical protein